MSRQWLWLVGVALLGGAGMAWAGAKDEASGGPYEYISEADQTSPCGKFHSVKMTFKDLSTGKQVKISAAESLKGKFKAGEVLTLTFAKGFGGDWIANYKAVKGVPGEEQPDVYLVKSLATQPVYSKERRYLTATKFGLEHKFLVPTAKNPAAAELLKKLDGLKANDLVVVKVAKSFSGDLEIKSIELYQPAAGKPALADARTAK